MERAVWGLLQAGILANKLLHKRLAPHGYYECINMPGLWRYEWCPITFTLEVDDFGVKYVGKEHADHLIACNKEKYKLTKDWTGDLYCGINLKWDFIKPWLGNPFGIPRNSAINPIPDLLNSGIFIGILFFQSQNVFPPILNMFFLVWNPLP
jgi:hypothetical protein